MRIQTFVVLLLGVACVRGDEAPDPTEDTAEVVDTGDTDAAPPNDSAVELVDSADSALVPTGDTGMSWPLAGYGAISGDCGDLRAVGLASGSPAPFDNVLDLATLGWDPMLLSQGGQTIWTTPNLGGSSQESEALSFDVMHRCERALLVETEAEIDYLDVDGKKTDYLVSIDGDRMAVSVTRAFQWPPGSTLTSERASELLDDKLGDVLLANDNVAPVDAWSRHTLHVIAWNEQHATAILDAWDDLPSAVQADTLLLVTRTDGDDGFVYGVEAAP